MLFDRKTRSRTNAALSACTAVLLTSLFCLAFSGCGSLPAVKAAEPDPQALVQDMLQTAQDAWNRGDNVTYASVFTDDVDFINIRGQIFTGKPAVTQVHAMLFAGPFKGSSVKITLRSFRFLAPGVALVDTDQDVAGFPALPAGIVATSAGVLTTHFKYIAQQQPSGAWLFSSGQNTSVLPN